MKLMVVTHNVPSLDSGAHIRNYYLLTALSRAHDVSLLVISDDTALDALQAHALEGVTKAIYMTAVLPGHFKRLYQLVALLVRQPSVMWRYSPPGAKRLLRRLISEQRFDAVLFESAVTAGHKLPAHVRMIIDEHNLEYELLERSAEASESISRRLHYRNEAAALKRAELKILGRADLILMTSEREDELLHRELPQALVRVIPNGVNITAFAPDERRPKIPGRVVFTGSMDYHPNEQAVLYFAEYCWPLIRARASEATWHIVGRNPSRSVQKLADRAGVTVTGSVPETQPFIADACVAIAPILVGSGTRLKILEAMAMGTAVVSTSVGCEGLELTPGSDLVVADNPAEFADEVVRLLHNEKARAQIGARGRETVVRQYSWEHVGDLLVDALGRLDELERERHVVLADS